jgi:hypothetical protein
MQLALEYGIEPKNMALGAMAGIAILLEKAQEYNLQSDLRFGNWRRLDDLRIEKIISWVWNGRTCEHAEQLIKYVQNTKKHLMALVNK